MREFSITGGWGGVGVGGQPNSHFHFLTAQKWPKKRQILEKFPFGKGVRVVDIGQIYTFSRFFSERRAALNVIWLVSLWKHIFESWKDVSIVTLIKHWRHHDLATSVKRIWSPNFIKAENMTEAITIYNQRDVKQRHKWHLYNSLPGGGWRQESLMPPERIQCVCTNWIK